MILTDKIQEAIDAFTLTDPEERYEVHIPSRKGKKRGYLGLSGLGEECARKVWYDWRHCFEKSFPARILRLFRRGDREEYVFHFLLKGIGCTVFATDEDGRQFKVSDFEGHLSGHSDGVLTVPKKFWKPGSKPHPVLAEYKTYNAKRFNELTKRGVAKSDPKYYVQMQGYMGYEKLQGALFCAACKDDDHLHFEYVPFKQGPFESLVSKADEIISASSPPPKVASSASDYRCKYCEAAGICHKGEASVKSCRSCKFACPVGDAKWECSKAGQDYGEVCKHWKDVAK
jgi:hypothetical protein